MAKSRRYFDGSTLEHMWTSLKHRNDLYYLNKFISVIISVFCALLTITLRAKLASGHTPCETEDYKFLFWMLFLFYSFHALGECHELYLVMNKQ